MSAVGLEEAVRRGAEVIGWKRRQQIPPSSGSKKRGIGMAMVQHAGGGQPFRPGVTRIEIDSDGRVLLFSGTPDQGCEQQTGLRQMAAEILQIPLQQMGGTNADTAICPRDTGPIASRTVYTTGTAATRAALEMKKKLLELASRLLEAAPDDLKLQNGHVEVRGAPARKMSFAALAQAAGGLIQADGYFNAREQSRIPFGFAATFAEVELDVETGEVKVLRLVSSHDLGRAINPVIVEGQIQGGASWGLSNTLTEGFYFDERTGTALNQWFLDLKTPSTLDCPDIETVMVEDEEPTHPFGAKGCSEISIVGVAPAISNAIYNATGVRMTELPITPDRILEALRAQNGGQR